MGIETTREELQERHRFVERVRSLVGKNISVIPLEDLATKKPAVRWAAYQQRAAEDATVIRWFERDYPGVAIVTGYNQIGALDVDCDHDDGAAHAAWSAAVEARAPGLLGTLVVESTRSGGRHYWYRCQAVEKGRDLARGKNGQTLLELKEHGRICVCAPTPGYTVLQGTLDALPEITPEQRLVLIEEAVKLNEVWAATRQGERYADSDTKPGSVYTRQATFEEVLQLLLDAHWRVVRTLSEESVKLERPGKYEDSTSADLSYHEGVVKFYCYTSNARPFEAMTAYNAFQVRALLLYSESSNPWASCARDLAAAGYGESPTAPSEGEGEGESRMDAGQIADAWAERHQARWRFDAAQKQWRRWDETHWSLASDHEEERLHAAMIDFIHVVGRRPVTSSTQVESTLKLARRLVSREFTRRGDGQTQQGILNFSNGTLGADGVLRPHDPEDLLTRTLGYPYSPTLPYPRITRFLEETIPDPGGRVCYMAHLGLALLKDTTMQKAVVLIGPRASGKSTLLKLGNLVCGNVATEGPGETLFDNGTEGMRCRASWSDRSLVCIDELPERVFKNEEVSKALLSHMSVPMRALYGRELLNNAWLPKVLTSTNETPHTKDVSGALARRLLYIACPHSLSEKDPRWDPKLLGKLELEVPGFAVACLQAAAQVLEAGRYPDSESMQRLNLQTEIESDALKAFLHFKCAFDPTAWTASERLHQAYIGYCLEQGHTRHLSMTRMTRRIMERYGDEKGLEQRARVATPGTPRSRGIVGLRIISTQERLMADLDAPDLLME